MKQQPKPTCASDVDECGQPDASVETPTRDETFLVFGFAAEPCHRAG